VKQETLVIRLLLFAQLKDRLGRSELSFSLPLGSTGKDLLAQLGQNDPTLQSLLSVSRLAVNCEYTSLDQILREGDEVALIPPVSGG